jgi:hypothetical protein
MAGTSATADGPRDAFRKQIRIAAARYHLERLTRASWPIAWSIAATFWVVLILSLCTPVAAYALQIALALLALGLVGAVSIYCARLDRRRLFIRMDAHGKLPDSVLSAGDWENAVEDPWRERQRVETLRLLEKMDWKKAWPVTWPRLLWLPLTASFLLLITLGFVQHGWIGRTALAHLAEQQENAPVTAEQLKPLEQVFQDWDSAQKIAPSPEMQELLKQIKPMRDEMASGKMTEKQVLLKLNEVQARLQAAKDRLEASSLDPLAQSMADAVKDLDGMSGLAAALQRKDFAAAKEQAAQAQEKYNSGAAKMPEGDKARTAANHLGAAAQKASKDSQTSSSLGQMQNAVSKNDSSGMSKGLGGLKGSLGRQAQRQAQGKSLGTQLAQIDNFKNGMGKGDGEGTRIGLPQLSLAKSLEAQKGAGSTVDPNRFGAQTQLDANHQEMKITGTAGDGASEKQTESTNDPHLEQTASGVNSAQFSAYKKLSEQATEDENLPVADRQMIKRYFEDIRPQANP